MHEDPRAHAGVLSLILMRVNAIAPFNIFFQEQDVWY